MKTDRRPSDSELFASYAQNDLGKWQKLKGLQVKHKTLGNGIITGVDRAFNNQIDVRVQFHSDSYWTRSDPFKDEFVSNLTELVLTDRLKLKILKGWKTTHQKWERTKKDWKEKQQREWERILEQKLERQKEWERPKKDWKERQQRKKKKIQEQELEKQKELELRKQKRESEKQRQLELRRREEEEKRIHRRPLEPFIQAAKQVFSTQMKVTVDSPILNAQDIQLALEWYRGLKKPVILQQSGANSLNKDLLIEIANDDDELERVLSARAAEKSVMEFYQRNGYYVEDVSIHGVTSESPDWKQYDLKINGSSFDVKNSRCSEQNPNSYVEHCVPSFKRDRSNRDVTIAGVLSPNLPTSKILNPESLMNQNTPILFLGLTSIKELTEIRNEFETRDLLEINLQRRNRSGYFLPPWMFNYPRFLYGQRDTELNKIVEQTVPEYGLWKEFNLNPTPLCTAAGIDLGQLWSSEILIDWERSFLSTVVSRPKKHRLSLPYLFLSMLKHFLQMVSANEGISYRPTGYMKLIYDPKIDPSYNMPLGIYDPLCTIYNLITSLDKLWKAEPELIRSFKMFRLWGLNILRGRREENERWKTLIAYCGGPKCGKDPLVLGDCEHCRECGMLICSDCKFCSKNCSEYDLRRHEFENSQSGQS